MYRARRRTSAGLLFISITFGLAATAQVHVAGRVSSDTGAPIAKAAVTIRAAARAAPVRVVTDPAGKFAAEFAEPGDYLVSAEATGFFVLKDNRVALQPGANEINLTLAAVREFADSVDVTATTNTVALDTARSEETLSGTELLEVPFPRSHDLKQSMRLLPGVVQDSRGGIHAGGGSEDQTLYLLDGFNIGDPLTGKFTARVGVESVQEMTVETGRFSAEYGRASAAVLSIDTKTGDDRVRYSATNFVPGLENQKGWRIGAWNPRFNISGPVRRGRVWFSDSFTGQYDQNVIRELPSGHDTNTSLRGENFLRLQANLTPHNILNTGFLTTFWSANRSGLSALDPETTTLGRHARQVFAYIKDQYYLGEGALIEFGYAANRSYSRQTPQGNDLLFFTPDGRRGNYFVSGTQDSARDQLLANAFLPGFHWFGFHQLKTGVDFDRLEYDQNLRRTGFEYLGSNDTPVRRVVYEGTGAFGRASYQASAYAQDGWRALKSVLVELGVRADWDNLLRTWTSSPRVGVAWSPPRMSDTKISAGYAVTYDAANLLLFTRPLDQYQVTFLYPPYGPPDQPIRSLYYNPGRGFESPRFHNWSAAVDQRLWSNMFARFEALRRRGDHGLTYLPSVADNPFDRVFWLGNFRSDSYTSASMTLRQNLKGEYAWLGSYTWSRTRSNAVIDVASDDPTIVASNAGPMPWDAPHRLLGWAYVPLPVKNWAIASLAEYRTGFPFSVVNAAGAIVGDPNSYRYPAFFEANISLERKFQWHGQRWAGRAGFINITNHRNYNTVNNDIDAPGFMSFAGGQGRAFNFRIRWLGKL